MTTEMIDCDECAGSGEVWRNESDNPACAESRTCPTCRGDGAFPVEAEADD